MRVHGKQICPDKLLKPDARDQTPTHPAMRSMYASRQSAVLSAAAMASWAHSGVHRCWLFTRSHSRKHCSAAQRRHGHEGGLGRLRGGGLGDCQDLPCPFPAEPAPLQSRAASLPAVAADQAGCKKDPHGEVGRVAAKHNRGRTLTGGAAPSVFRATSGQVDRRSTGDHLLLACASSSLSPATEALLSTNVSSSTRSSPPVKEGREEKETGVRKEGRRVRKKGGNQRVECEEGEGGADRHGQLNQVIAAGRCAERLPARPPALPPAPTHSWPPCPAAPRRGGSSCPERCPAAAHPGGRPRTAPGQARQRRMVSEAGPRRRQARCAG
jgi:hypothetical protein